ncbi:ubiquinol oxidase subunit II [Pseudomonas citronellolis]|jgi:cytochrome o ubiquinol oxidase subunit 2|uniref:ubiquinol oxidase subunit II n=1 Tax=Pseudomonas TaxID=286 RepID=UPI0002A42955|nr:Cytochrome bo(3) ubiquinol oxidase subunit 2 precursor [Pseudomonas citronellolis]KES21610.1 cytochrome O ubiquinol oxidase subunit II [Pseudomonas sp. AAC]NTX90155.1 ubiquinol oxidase subunit II [Pseudomonas sp. UMA643]NTY20711.1 ubiquinol oxidase subunit II [Pseudomonas sp. UMC3103]NTY26049.1 ubiquinol oxidase subunit II [Pseudomonas sp. UMA603]NTY30345.1 ubiquinol oxidase subunit II [Pseudomonas sp. UMC3129]NTY56179.1 ubiquinol oxidase subunit II [Pseudomonas sp. UMC631]NTY68542.1 ubiq
MKIDQYSGYLKRLSVLLPLLSLGGCNMVLFDPKGQIGVDEKSLIITCTLLMLLVVVPVIVMTLAFAWKYRASNTKATYMPDWAHSTRIEVVVWLVPCIIIAILGWLTWESTHKLDPYRPLDSDVKPITIQAVSLDWKWLFIYPEQGIATVNEIAFPKDTPVNFQITSDTVMNSFFIPQLGSQIYSMTGMLTKLHLIANEEGVFDGISANYSGSGFSGMKFKAIATSEQGFQDWVAKVKSAQAGLTEEGFPELAKPSENVPATYFSSVTPDLFQHILTKHERAGLAMGKGKAEHAEGEAESQSNPSIQE